MNCIELALYNEMIRKKQKIFDDRYENPAFGVVTSLNSNGSSGPILYNHNLEPVGRVESGGSNTQQSEFGHQAATQRSTQSHTYRTAASSGTNMIGHLGHAQITLGRNNEMLFGAVKNFGNLRDVGTVANSTRPDLAIFMSDNKFWFGSRRMETGPDSRYGHKVGLDGIDTCQSYGSIGFNEKTGTLAVLLSENLEGDWEFKLTTWENLSPPQDFESSEDFFSQEGITADLAIHCPKFILPGGIDPQYLEGKKRAVLVVCDNGNIVISKMLPHQGYITFVVEKDGDNFIPPDSNLFFHHWTTSYGCEQGPLYGIRHVVSLDGKYIVAYSAAYYYAGGIRYSVTRVSDGKTMVGSSNDAHYGFQVIPYKENDFLITRSMNANSGKGLHFYRFNVSEQIENGVQGGHFVTGSILNGELDSGYYSTNYPFALPIFSEENEIFKAGETQ